MKVMGTQKQICKFKPGIFGLLLLLFVSSCYTSPAPVRTPTATAAINLPFLRLEQAGECYYIDDFLPTPDSLVTGKSGGLYLRYYTYWNAKYKFWSEVGIMLSFYSRDSRCWSLFEEYVLPGVYDNPDDSNS